MTTDTVTARECAERWNVSPSLARRILAPLTPTGRHLTTGAMLYNRTDADNARDRRPGRGARTDLTA